MQRGKTLLELMDPRELERKRGPRVVTQPVVEPHEAPQDIWSRVIGMRHRATSMVRRFFVVFAALLVVMLLHAYEPFRVRAAILIGATSSSDPVRALSVAVPLAVAASVLLAWAT